MLKIGDLYVLLFWVHATATNDHEAFACSHDLQNWPKWNGTGLTPGREPWEGSSAAHKPWVFRKDGVVYHFFNYTHLFDGKPHGGIGLAASSFMGKNYQGEELEIIGASQSHLVVTSFDCASYQVVHFRGEVTGDYIRFVLPVPVSGKYRLKVRYIAGPDSGPYKLKFNDTLLPELLDAYAPVSAPRIFEAGIVRVTTTGRQSISFEARTTPHEAQGLHLRLDNLILLKI